MGTGQHTISNIASLRITFCSRYARRMGANRRYESLSEMVSEPGGLEVRCGCGHKGVVDGRKLARLFFVRRWNSRIHMIGAHLRCSKCGGRPVKISATWAKPDGPPWGPRSEADWKRLAARLRG